MSVAFLLWSNKHGMWWKPNEYGYAPNIDEAGRFSEETAVKCVVRSAMCGDLSKVTVMVAAPDNWAMRPSAVRVVAGPGPLAQVLPEALAKLADEKAAAS